MEMQSNVKDFVAFATEGFDKFDFSQMDEKDKIFMKKLSILAQVDRDILRRVIIMRHKLNNEIKLTREEARELLEVLECKGFYLTGLDVSGYEFAYLRMEGAVIGGDLNMNHCTILGDNHQEGMLVLGNNLQSWMQVKGNNHQSHVRVVYARIYTCLWHKFPVRFKSKT